MNLILALFVICSATTAYAENPFGLSDEILKALEKLDPKLLPAAFHAKFGDASHWCCSNMQPVNTEQRTRVDHAIHTVATKVKAGYTNCGFLGADRCGHYETRYKQVVVYHIQTYEVPVESACLDHHVVCCEGYVNVAGNCHTFSLLGEHIDTLLQLVQAGLLPPSALGGRL